MKPTDRPRPTISRSEWGLLMLLAAVQFTNILDFVIVMPLAPLAREQYSITPKQFGYIVGSYGFAACLGSLLSAKFLDRFCRKRALLSLYLGFTVSTLLCGLAPTYESLVVARAVAGFFGGVVGAAVMAIVGDVFADYRRGTAMGVVMSAFAVASVIGIPIGMFLAENFDVGAPFTALAGLSMIVWFLGFFLLPSLRGHMLAGRKHPTILELAGSRNHLLAYAFNLTLTTSGFLVVPFIADAMVTNAGQSKENVKYVYLVGGIFTLVSTNVIGRLADRFGKKFVFRIVAIAAIVMALILTNLHPVPLWVVILVCTGFMVCMSGRFVPAQALITGSARPEVRGGFLSLNSSIGFLAMGLASTIAGMLVGSNEPPTTKFGEKLQGLIALAIMAIGMLVGQSPDSRLPGYPLVGIISSLSAVISLVLVGLLKTGDVPNTSHVLPTPELVEEVV
ncbi:MFS transporter [Zavarzinella formosa]|uniref:MFS transporter n=1 Tax=Zavarzinella formosa TaxID=360055 RepID=UPI00036989BA|nr:MFS transporter [Zavarzinella formosa]